MELIRLGLRALAGRADRYVLEVEVIVYPEELMAQRIKELEDELIGIRAAIEDMENPFSGGGAPEMHYGFERAIEDATNLINEALGEKQ